MRLMIPAEKKLFLLIYLSLPTLSLSLSGVPPNIADLKNLEVLNMFNNQIEELPTQISSLQKLKHLNLGLVKSISSQFVLSFLTLPLLYFCPFVLSFICFVTFSFRLLSIILSSLLLLYLHLSLFFFSFL